MGRDEGAAPTGPLEPILGRKNHIDFESAMQNIKLLQTEGTNQKTENYKTHLTQLLSDWGEVSSDLDETWGKFFLASPPELPI